jgi:hypothetical protein
MAITPYPLPRETRESAILVGNGTVGPYGPSTFKVFDTIDVIVLAKAAGEDFFSDVTSVATVDKTAGLAFDTFSILFDDAVPPTTQFYYAARRIAERTAAVTRAGSIDSNQLEKELSKQATVLSELRRDIDNGLQLPPGTGGMDFPPASAGKLIGWAADGQLENKTPVDLDGEILPAVASTVLVRSADNQEFETKPAGVAGLANLAAVTPADALATPVDGTVTDVKVATTAKLYNRINGIIDVRDEGASPSASAATNAAAFQAAINAVIANGSGRVKVPTMNEDFEIGSTLEIFYRHRNGTTTAPDSGDGTNHLAGVLIEGDGASTLDSIFDTRRGSTLIYTGTDTRGLFDMSSDWGANFSRLRFMANSGVATAQLFRMRSYDTPIFSATGTVFDQCSFIDESDLITDAIITMRERKHVRFVGCNFLTGTDALRIGEDAGVNATLMNGSVSSVKFQNCVFAGDIRLRKAHVVDFDNCEWFPRKGTTVGARIYMDGLADVENVSFLNPKAMFDGDGTAFFYTQAANSRGLTCIGGAIGDYARAFSLSGFGPVQIVGTSFDNTDSDIVLNNSNLFPVDIRADHSRTLAGSGIAVTDNRVPANIPTTADLNLAADYAMPSAAATWQIPTGMSKSIDIRGGVHKVSYGITVTAGIDQTIKVRLAIPGEVQESIVTEFVGAGQTKTITFSKDIDLTGAAAAATVSLQVQHSAISSATVVKASAAGVAGTFLQAKPI